MVKVLMVQVPDDMFEFRKDCMVLQNKEDKHGEVVTIIDTDFPKCQFMCEDDFRCVKTGAELFMLDRREIRVDIYYGSDLNGCNAFWVKASAITNTEY